MTHLLDASVLVALTFPAHVHHDAVHAWREQHGGPFATCPITQGALLRMAVREGSTPSSALALLQGVRSVDGHEFWPDDVEYTAVRLTGLVGHRQVTDAYLAGLARARGAKVATLDGGLAQLHPDVAVLVPTGRAAPG